MQRIHPEAIDSFQEDLSPLFMKETASSLAHLSDQLP